MTAIISLLVIITLSVLTTRIGTLALIHTGLSKEVAKFQARSAYLGVGFTTRESEMVMKDGVRRKILTILIFLGNAGIITTISSAIFSFISIDESGLFSPELLVLIAGLLILLALSRSRYVDQKLSEVINKALKKYTYLDVKDYYSLLHIEEDYRVSEIKVRDDDWLNNKCLKELQLEAEGVRILGIKRENGRYIGAPVGKTRVRTNDILIIYGRTDTLKSLENRKEGLMGDTEHSSAVNKQEEIEKKEKSEN